MRTAKLRSQLGKGMGLTQQKMDQVELAVSGELNRLYPSTKCPIPSDTNVLQVFAELLNKMETSEEQVFCSIVFTDFLAYAELTTLHPERINQLSRGLRFVNDNAPAVGKAADMLLNITELKHVGKNGRPVFKMFSKILN